MRRAGLDYHEFAGISQYSDWHDFMAKQGQNRLFGVSTKASVLYSEARFMEGDFLIFGPETRGLPDGIREQLGPDNLLRIPMLRGQSQPESLQCYGCRGLRSLASARLRSGQLRSLVCSLGVLEPLRSR